MEKEVDVITLCKRIIDLTNQEKCSWRETSENNRYKLSLKNGAIEIHHFKPADIDFLNPEYYDVSLFDNKGERYATYKAYSTDEDRFKVFSNLYITILKLLEKIKRRKIALLFEELETSEDK